MNFLHKFLSVVILISLSVLSTSCAPQDVEPISISTEGYDCINYPGFEWGISKEQLFEALGKTEEDFDQGEGEEGAVQYITKNEFLGKECLTAFEFSTYIKSKNEVSPLSAVRVGYELGDKKYEDLKAELEALIKSQGVEYTVSEPKISAIGESYRIYVNKRVKDLPQELLDNENNYWCYLIENDLIEFDDSQSKERLLKINWALILEDEPISSVRVFYTHEDNICRISFDSYRLINPLAESEVYLKQFKD